MLLRLTVRLKMDKNVSVCKGDVTRRKGAIFARLCVMTKVMPTNKCIYTHHPGVRGNV